MKNYKVLGIDGTDENFSSHDEAMEFVYSLDCHPKGVYKILNNGKLGELNMFAGLFSGECYTLIDAHRDKGYTRVVI